MTVVATAETRAVAARMIQAAAEYGGAEAVLMHLRECRPDQSAALVAVILNAATKALQDSAPDPNPRMPDFLTEDQARRLHAQHVAAKAAGVEPSEEVKEGERQYQRVKARQKRARRRRAKTLALVG